MRITGSAALVLAASGIDLRADPPFVFSGLPIDNPKFSMRVNIFGYSDSMLDRRSKFLDREYLSGEWAAAIYYEGGSLPAMSRWLTDRFVYPDFYTYVTMPNFANKNAYSFMSYGLNGYGFEAFGSTIYNADLEINMRYETVDLGTDMTNRLAIGLTPQSLGGGGTTLNSQRYLFKQTYNITNTTGNTLTNVRLYQALHTLYGDWGAYDARMHGGAFPDYQYGVTLQGKSYGFNFNTYETVEHTDTLAMKFNWMPSGFELGAFGMKNAGDHQTGEPAVGVHKSVLANSLNGSDFFDPDENDPDADAWVMGALSFNLGSLLPDETKSISVLLGLHTTYQVIAPPIQLKVHNAGYAGGMYTIDFEEMTHNPQVGYILRKSSALDMPPTQWDQLAVPYTLNLPFPNWARFQFPVDPGTVPKEFYSIQPVIVNSF